MTTRDVTDDNEFEIPQELYDKLAADPFAILLGISIDSIKPGYARASMSITQDTLNAATTAHGGAMMALIDVVHAAVSNSHGTLAVAQEVHTEFLNAGTVGDVLTCEGTELSLTKRTAVFRMDVWAEPREGVRDERKLVSTALARVFRIGKPWVADEIGEGTTKG